MTEISPRKIIIALDGSDYSRQAFEFALTKVLRKERDEIVLLNVRPAADARVSEALMSQAAAANLAEKKSAEEAASLLDEYAKTAEAKNLKVTKVTESGDARETIVSVVEKENADLLIIGSHGKGVTKRLLLGSVSDYCAHHASCPVLIHRPQRKA